MSTQLVLHDDKPVRHEDLFNTVLTNFNRCASLSKDLSECVTNTLTNIRKNSMQRRAHRKSHIPIRAIYDWSVTTKLGMFIKEDPCQKDETNQ